MHLKSINTFGKLWKKFNCDKTNVLKISMKYTTTKSDREPLTQCNKQDSIL